MLLCWGMSKIAWLVGVAGVAGVLGGCVGPLNNEVYVGDRLKASQQYAPASIAERAEDRAETGAGEEIEVSVNSLDRSGWSGTRVVVPNDLVMHQPRYTDNWHFNRSNRRARGEYPTAASALDMPTEKGADQQIKEAALAPLVAGFDIAAMPVRMGGARPWQRTMTGSEPYQRVAQVRTEVPEGVMAADDGDVMVVRSVSAGAEPAGKASAGKGAGAKVNEDGSKSLQWPKGSSAPGSVRPAQAPKAAEEDAPKWDRAPVATDERGKNAAPAAKPSPEQEKK